jgi:hypothetical protein
MDGEVAALKAAGGRRLRVATDGGDGWTDRLPAGAAVVSRRDATVTVALPPTLDPGAVLDVARRSGRLVDVHLDQPRLSELFRTAVADRPDLAAELTEVDR